MGRLVASSITKRAVDSTQVLATMPRRIISWILVVGARRRRLCLAEPPCAEYSYTTTSPSRCPNYGWNHRHTFQRRTPGSGPLKNLIQGLTPISVNLIKGISPSFPAGLRQLHCDLIPVPECFGQTVTGQNRHTDLVKHEFNLSPSATPHCPIGIPRGKTCRPLPPCVRPRGWRKSFHAATLAHLPGPFSAGAPAP
jgi:hypothetical protein